MHYKKTNFNRRVCRCFPTLNERCAKVKCVLKYLKQSQLTDGKDGGFEFWFL